ncbi:MAG: tyrosine-type recombinase/integrase [Micromonosporaceae bacterium]
MSVADAGFTVKPRSNDHEESMGYSRKRTGRDGKPRYTSYYWDLRGRERSAGTYATKREADKAWQKEEAKVAEGRPGDPRRGRQTFQRYVLEEWFPNHVIEPNTRESYTYSINKHILPWFGPMRMAEILPAQVREWIAHLQSKGVTPVTIRYNKTILSAIFTAAFNDVVFIHPCKGVKTPTVPVKPRKAVTPEQFELLYQALSDADARLLVETDVESGLRWGELTELRPKDLDTTTRMLTVSRAVIEVNPKFHPDGGRFLVKEYPKDKEPRRLILSAQITRKLQAHIDDHALTADDLLFRFRPVPRDPVVVPDPDSLGLTEPNSVGRRYRHGTLSGYSAGRCRCRHCRSAYAVYRAQRRATRQDQPRGERSRDTDGHIPRDWFRRNVWNPALEAAGLKGARMRPNDLRHAHASWLLAGGADLQVVKERLGHASIATTEKYLHTLPDADESALDALTRIRERERARELPTTQAG